jgi:hypothetical protein
MSDGFDPVSWLAQAVGSSPETAATISGVATPALEGAALGAAGSAIAGGNAGTGALIGGGTGALIGGGQQLFGGGGSTAPTSTGTTGPGSGVSPGAIAAPPSVSGGNPDATTNAGGFTISDAANAARDSTSLPIPPVPPAMNEAPISNVGNSPVYSATAQPLTNANGETVYPTQSAADAALNFQQTGGNMPIAPQGQGNSLWNAITGKGSWKDAIGNNIGTALSAAPLALAAIKGNQAMPGQNAIASEAAALESQGKTLQSYVTDGTLPPGVATQLHQAGEAAKASIRSQYAARGMTGSSAEATDLANVDNTIVGQGASIASSLLQQGMNETNMSAQLYSTIMNNAVQQDAQLGNAISAFASGIAGSGKPITLNLNTATAP